MNEIEFWVPGIPKPQGSKRGINQGGKVRLIESAGEALKDWRANVAHETAQAMSGRVLLAGALSVMLTFYLPRPKSAGTGSLPSKRPDVDKLARGCLDAMTGIAFADDAQIVTLTARKLYARPGSGTGARISIVDQPR